MTITNVKAMVAKVLTVGFLAGAFVMAAPAKAEAQGFAVGVRFGAPVYVAPRYVALVYGYGYGYDVRRHDEWVRHEEFERQRAFERERDYDRYHHGPAYGYRGR